MGFMKAQAKGDWPPAFSSTYLAEARTLLERRGTLLIVGPPGSNRHRLARGLITADDEPRAWRYSAQLSDASQDAGVLRGLARHVGVPPEVPDAELTSAIARQVHDGRAGPIDAILTTPDFCDPTSLDALVHLASTQVLRLVTVLAPGAVGSVPQLAAIAERLDVPPLDPEVIARLLHTRFDTVAHPTVALFLHERSQGAYGILSKIADALAEVGMLVVVEGVLMLDPRRLTDAWASLPAQRRARSAAALGSGREIVDLLDLVSLIGQVEVAEARRCGGDSLDLAISHGALHLHDGFVSMTDTFEAGIIVTQMTPERLRHLWEHYAPLLAASTRRPDSLLRSARWGIAAGRSLPSDVVMTAAQEANARCLYDRVLELTDPLPRDEHRAKVAVERAHALIELGRAQSLPDLYDQIDLGTVEPDELFTLARVARRFMSTAEIAAMHEHVVATADDPHTRRQREAAMALAGHLTAASNRSSGALIRSVRTIGMSDALTPTLRGLSYTTLAVLLRNAGRPTEAVAAATSAIDLLSPPADHASSIHLGLAREVLVLAQVSALDIPGAARTLAEYARPATRHGGEGRLGLLLGGLVETHLGHTALALASLTMYLDRTREHDPHQLRGWAEALAAECLIWAGRREDGEMMLRRSEAEPPLTRTQSELERRLSQASARDVLGDPDGALELLEGIVTEARSHGLTLVGIDAAGLAVLIDGPGKLPFLLGAIDELDDPSGTPALWLHFARAAASFDFPDLIDLATETHAAGAANAAGRLAQYVLDAARRRTDLDAVQRATLEQMVALGGER